METKLTSITTQYRSFVNDQVLTADQLNNLIEYFGDQDRLSRVCLNGVGIVCGLKVESSSATQIVISQGCGVTTDGDLVQLQKPVPDKTTQEIDLASITFTNFKEFEDTNVHYDPFLNNGTQIKLYELIPDFQVSNSDSAALSTLPDLEKMIVLLYLEEFPKPPELCTTIDCNNQGVEEVARVKILLLSEEDAAFVKSSDALYTKHSIIEAYLQLPDVAVQRVFLTSNSASSITNLQKSFHSAVSSNNTVSQLKVGVTGLFSNFSGFLNLPTEITSTKINQLIDQWLGFSALNIPADFQYRYDLLKDLVDTYNEIKNILMELEAECCPEFQSFPKHLFLGRLTPVAGTEPYRHGFYKSPAAGKEFKNIGWLNSLITRFYLMLDQYSPSGNDVKVTPSASKVSLSNRSIPFYYTVNDQLLNDWDYCKNQKLTQKNNLSYSTANLSPAAHIQTPLKFNLDAFDFFRIEGQVGKSSVVAEPQLSDIRSNNGLDFDVVSFDVNASQADLQLFISKNNGLEHHAGVPKGGTFVLIRNANLVVADFAMSHKVAVAQAASCCRISECSFPWISSLKYLNNLSRSLRGTQSRKQLMPKTYRLLISQYSINGVSLISQATEVSVPFTDLFNRRVHAITQKLNEQFPSGLVFDFDQESKLLKIKKLKDDTFVFMVKDITISANSPVYTMTEKAFLRNGRILQSKAYTCVEINQLHKDFYLQLHATYDPRNKDDDYGKYDNKWKKWAALMEKLMHNQLFVTIKAKRFPTAIGDLPQEVQADLRKIKADITQTNETAKAYLSGDWTNGTWVNQDMITHYNANSKNTHDDIVKFIKLREYLHQKTGKSKYAIFVNLVTDAQFKSLQAKYLNKVDFYLGAATGTFIEF